MSKPALDLINDSISRVGTMTHNNAEMVGACHRCYRRSDSTFIALTAGRSGLWRISITLRRLSGECLDKRTLSRVFTPFFYWLNRGHTAPVLAVQNAEFLLLSGLCGTEQLNVGCSAGSFPRNTMKGKAISPQQVRQKVLYFVRSTGKVMNTNNTQAAEQHAAETTLVECPRRGVSQSDG